MSVEDELASNDRKVVEDCNVNVNDTNQTSENQDSNIAENLSECLLQKLVFDKAKNDDQEASLAKSYGITIEPYKDETDMPDIMKLITEDLSEPYSIYTYRYFINNWPHLCFLARHEGELIGALVSKLDVHQPTGARRGYIAMLAIHKSHRRIGLASALVRRTVHSMIIDGCDEVVLETEVTNIGALRLYDNFGFIRDKRLFRYYLNGVDAFRLKLWLR